MRISLSRNWLTNRVSVHSPCNGQANALQNSEGKFTNDQNQFPFLMKYFYNHINPLKVQINSMGRNHHSHTCAFIEKHGNMEVGIERMGGEMG